MKDTDSADRKFMAEALRLAARGRRSVSPNPMVGAVLVKGGKVLARGYHRAFGRAHAEVECLSRYKGPLEGTTLYLNLEPCAHYGKKTPPCAPLLASTKISRIVVAARDPNPLVGGSGIQILRAAGKRVDVGVLEEEARELNHVFMRSMVARRPYVHVKIAQTMDGKIGDRAHRVFITGSESQRIVHRLRAVHDAVLVGAGTVLIDDPLLTVRDVHGRDPDVVILDGGLRVKPTARALSAGKGRRVYLIAQERAVRRSPQQVRRLTEAGVQVIGVPSRSEILSIDTVLQTLRSENIGSVLVEGGQEVFTEFLSSGAVDEISLFVAPGMSGKGISATAETPWSGAAGILPAQRTTVRRAGNDLYLHARF